MRDTEEDLAIDIGMALRRSPLRGRAKTPDERDREVAAAAAAVVSHLKLCRWRFEREPPLPAHSVP